MYSVVVQETNALTNLSNATVIRTVQITVTSSIVRFAIVLNSHVGTKIVSRASKNATGLKIVLMVQTKSNVPLNVNLTRFPIFYYTCENLNEFIVSSGRL